jgi:hypothetical protein
MVLTSLEKGGISPFDTYPELNTIWSPEHTALARAATDDWLQTDDSGEICLIECIADTGVVIAGITGWWPLDKTRAGLRWHGVVEQYRMKRISRGAIRRMCNTSLLDFDQLVEVTMSDAPVDHFLAVGFVEVTDEKEKEELFDLVGGYGHRFLTLDVNIYRNRNFL